MVYSLALASDSEYSFHSIVSYRVVTEGIFKHGVRQGNGLPGILGNKKGDYSLLGNRGYFTITSLKKGTVELFRKQEQ